MVRTTERSHPQGALADLKSLAVLPLNNISDDKALGHLATIRTDPAGVQVSYKPYGTNDDHWQSLGLTPLAEIRLPLGHLHLKFEGEVVTTTERLVMNPSFLLDNFPFLPSAKEIVPEPMIHLAGAGEGRDGMVYVAAWNGPVPVSASVAEGASVPAYFIDTFEVTNAQFQEFVDASGYSDRRFWAELDFGDMDWTEALATFTDQTGQPGPTGWELGRYPHGTGDYPVTGVSWFEASAFARFKGKELPTFYHWYRAALDYLEVIAPLSPAIIKQSNFAGEGLAPVGQYPGLGFFGTFDMGGNAREWLLNADEELRWVVGGGWNQAPYMLAQGDFDSPFDRGLTNGFRCMVSADGSPVPEDLTISTNERAGADAEPEAPVSDEVYAIYREQFNYLKQELDPQLVSSFEWPHWQEELIHINSPYTDEGMDLLLLLPAGSGAPLQAMIFMPGSDAFFPGASMAGYNWEDYESSVAAVLHSGRAVVIPFWDSAFGRGLKRTTTGQASMEDRLERKRTLNMHWRQDLGTTLDYLETRGDIDSERIGFFGVSYGAIQPIAMLAVETRLKTAILVAGGLALHDLPPVVRPVNHVPRITMPVLMMNGRYDHTVPLASSQQPLFELLGSRPEQKKHVTYDAGHIGFPAHQQRREIGSWLDTYLGRVR